MNKNLRAYYKPDFTTKDGPLKFIVKEIDEQLFFVCEKDSELKYPFEIPFLDNDWVVQQSIGIKDIKGCEVFEGDVIKCLAKNYFGDKTIKIIKVEIQSNLTGQLSLDWYSEIEVIGNSLFNDFKLN